MYRIKSKHCDAVDDKKQDSSPSLRCVRCLKVEITMEMFRTKLQSLKWSRRAGKLYTDINLVPLLPVEDKTFSGLLVLTTSRARTHPIQEQATDKI